MAGQGRQAGDPQAIRREQVACYMAEDFERYFELSTQLAVVSPGYVLSYEYGLQIALHTLARTVPDLQMLQVGAMDGKTFDPVYPFVKHYGWGGLILEPLPDLFAALAAHYEGCDHVTLVRAALTEADGRRAMTRVSREAARDGAVPAWAEGLGSFHPARNALGGVGVDAELHAALRDASRQEEVDCVTLRTLVARHGLPRLDLLQVDAEGCELDILRQVLAFPFAPRAIHLEHWALPRAERGALLGLLGERGYVLRMGESDVLAVDPALRAALEEAVGWAV